MNDAKNVCQEGKKFLGDAQNITILLRFLHEMPR